MIASRRFAEKRALEECSSLGPRRERRLHGLRVAHHRARNPALPTQDAEELRRRAVPGTRGDPGSDEDGEPALRL